MDKAAQIVTIDGPAGAGKSTVAKALARELGWTYLDTGAMYRAVGLAVERAKADVSSQDDLRRVMESLHLDVKAGADATMVFLDGEDVTSQIRRSLISSLASRASKWDVVRRAMTEIQRKIGRSGQIVAEGRDMGTVVFPDAGMKFFLSASLEVRAKRRYHELLEKGEDISLEAVAEDMKKRDHDDSSRTIAPLQAAPDAVTVDTSGLDISQVVTLLMQKTREKFGLRTG